MTIFQKPSIRPKNPYFSSGPCAKPASWTLHSLKDAALGRSHRAKIGKSKLKEAIERTRSVLEIPSHYKIGIVPASDTGAVEMALWSLLGHLPVQMLAWESFGAAWVNDVMKQLKIEATLHKADYGALPDLSKVNCNHDVVFTWNGTTSGVRVPNGDWIATNRKGLTICDATSAAFAQNLPWEKLDVTTFSWQKVLGGEAAHGMIILSPRAVERLEHYTPPWPLPKIFRLTKSGKLNHAIFEGATINTPSMLAVEDYLFSLKWAETQGNVAGLIEKANHNASVIAQFVAEKDWLEFLAIAPETRSNTCACLKITSPRIIERSLKEQSHFVKAIIERLEQEHIAYDIGSYRDAPLGLRIWTGSTIEADDLKALCAWLDWAFHSEIENLTSH